MSTSQVIRDLRRIDNLREGNIGGCPVYAHDDHRFLLPILFEMQLRRHLPRPCQLVMFDAHHDALPPRTQRARDRIVELTASGFTGHDLLNLCVHELCRLDDDWLTTGMSLGLIQDAVIFGVGDRTALEASTDPSLSLRDPHLAEFRNSAGVLHSIHMRGFPGEGLGSHGFLRDHARTEELAPLWNALDWDYHRPSGFGDSRGPVLVSIDLDAFVMEWRGFVFPWPDEVFSEWFLKRSNSRARGWTGQRFFDALLRRAGTVAIACEPTHCGGPSKTPELWRQVNRFLFGGGLKVS